MGKRCCIKSCCNTRDNDPDLSLYKFPRENIPKYDKWLQAIPPDLITLPIQQNAYICSIHFSTNFFRSLTLTGKNLLKQDAIPSIFYTESENGRNENNIIENSIHEIEQTPSTGKIDETTIKRASVDMSTQVSSKRQRISENNTQLQRKVHILQKRLHRRELTITTMRNLIDALKSNNMHTHALEQVLISNFDGLKLECILNKYKNQNIAKTWRRYTPQMKQFALTLYFYSPKAYDFL